ncbi:MAG TPA: MdtA/MuxA family multidrug efflux RND transporter periplasmic adaptor subunit [Terriglobia bacterium]|nr:MdtA/MuxA family multidrug efflux RND transporter periplasmic adaptor subunit [Terriglobia bacterium]
MGSKLITVFSPASDKPASLRDSATLADTATARARKRWPWIVLACLGLALGAWLVASRVSPWFGPKTAPAPAPAPPTIPVVTATATRGNQSVYLTGLGTVTPLNTVTLRTRVDGQLMRVAVTEGQMVSAGDLIAEIDPRPFQVQLTQAESQKEKDEAILANARLDLQRYTILFGQDSIPKQQLDSQAALVLQNEAAVRADQGAIDAVRLQLIYTRITSPITGRIGLRQIDPGNIVHAADDTGLAVITQLQPIAVIFSIPQDDIPRVMRKLRAGRRLEVDAYDREFKVRLATGSLLTVDNQVDVNTGTVRLKATFSNRDLSLFPNQFVNARLLIDVRRGAVLIPAAAIQRGAEAPFVYAVTGDNTVEERAIAIGPIEGDIAAIDQGLSPGDVVVTEGTDKLQPGAKVEPRGEFR